MTNEVKEDQERAKEQAKMQLEGIVQLVNRLNHLQDCNGEDCDLTDQEIYGGINLCYTEGDKATQEEREQYHDEDDLRQTIDEDPLSVQVRSGWANSPSEFEAEEFEILLCTGGPACRIVGELDRGQPDRARLEYQDWFTPWIEYLDMTSEERDALLTYAQQFYFGE